MAENQVIVTDYEALADDIRSVRDAVFLVEQRISPADEIDDRDTVCRHVVVYCDGKPVATGRLDSEKNGKVGRVAVLAEFRRKGIGSEVMRAIEGEARKLGLPKVWFHAQQSAVQFYLTLGYATVGDEFLEAEIVHVRMEKELTPINGV